MKRVLAVLMVLSILLSFVMPVSASPLWLKGEKAMPPGLQKLNKVPYGLAKKVFEDADLFSWAQRSIEKLGMKGLIKGRLNGLYDPRGTVTKLEAVIMALRVMGWENETLNIKELPAKYRGGSVGKWAYGYINVAYKRGILDDVDMMYFDPNAPALRHEVAKYVVRALGYEDEAQDRMNKKLPFDDAALVPSGSIGYVYDRQQ